MDTVAHKLTVTMPGGGTADANHIFVAIVAAFETNPPGSAAGAWNAFINAFTPTT